MLKNSFKDRIIEKGQRYVCLEKVKNKIRDTEQEYFNLEIESSLQTH